MICHENINYIVETCKKENPCKIDIRYNEPMAGHTSFKVGGPTDCWLRPVRAEAGSDEDFYAFTAALLSAACTENVPVFLLGGGANILVADAGIRGIVLDTGGWTGVQKQQEGLLEFRCGTSLDDAAEIAADLGLSGLEFLAGMPGSIGGAVWMNARCYGREIADVLAETEIIDFTGDAPLQLRLPAKRTDFGYKRSPFQGTDHFILSASLQLTPGNTSDIRAEMDAHRRDREEKGHYRYPSAGSVFKNNEDFGKPTGKIIEELGLRGLRIGGAQVAPWHGNFIVNTDAATASDIRALVNEVAAKVKTATNFELEPEILFMGEW
ncbi:MAG: UDP-N-acetylmuramate dehydrogenase [Treponema sp.]|nr:UDP-N-acetylmuramate dehydrogenase [Treponema sp.]